MNIGSASLSGIFEDGVPESGTTQRRSKTEMVCDLMLAISRGAVRPTRIMQRANLTWNALLMYLYALASSGLVWREERGSVSLYHLTDKGTRVLQAYLTLKDGLGELKLESMDTKVLADAMRTRSGTAPDEGDQEALLAWLGNQGFKVLPKAVKGKSGVEHEFQVVAKDPKDGTHGYVFARQPDDNTLLGLFVKQPDTGLQVHIVHKSEPDALAAQRAREYGVELVKVQSLKSAEKKPVGSAQTRYYY